MRLLTIISGAMLIMTSLFCFANPGETFLALAFVLGVAMILTGLIQCVSYWWGRDNRHDNNGWIFADALMTLILGILVLTSLIAADAAIPMVFGLWVMSSGILRIVVATMIDPKTKKKNFFWAMLTGVVGLVSGLYAFLNPYIANLNIAVLLGLMFIIQGILTMELGIHMPHEKKEKAAKPKAKMIKIQIKKPIKKKVDKELDMLGAMPVMNLNTDNISSEDIENYKTEEIKLDDIRAALEFNFGADNETSDEPAEAEPAVMENEADVTEEESPEAEATADESIAAETLTEEPAAEEPVTEEPAAETEEQISEENKDE